MKLYGLQGIYSHVFLLLAVHFLCSNSAEFITHPNNVTEIIGGTVTFNCATEDEPFIDWVVLIPAISERRFETSSQVMVTELNARGFILGDLIESEDFTYHMNLTVPALREHNNTEVICRAFASFDGAAFSYPASLKILGPPSPPEPSLTLLFTTTLKIDWDPPFTWENHSIIGYQITVHNTSEPLGKKLPTQLSANVTTYNHSWPHQDDLLGTRCDTLIFSVTASSDIGESAMGNVSGGFPMRPREASFIDCDTCQVTFNKTGHPQFRATIQLPSVCSYQTANFVIELSTVNIEDDTILEIISSNYTGGGIQVPITLDSDLTVNESYSLKVKVVTVAGNSSMCKNFSTAFDPPTGTSNSETGGEVYTVIGVIFVAVIIIILGATTVAIVLIIRQSRRKALRHNVKTVDDNGIDGYGKTRDESHVYESIDTYQSNLKQDVPPPYQFMGSGFPNATPESIKIKQPTHSHSTASSMNEYVTTQSTPSTPKKECDIDQSTQSKESAVKDIDSRVSSVTMGEEGGYTYMRSFSVQKTAQGEEELA